MTFWDHLEEARWSIVRMLAAVGVCMVPAFIFMPWIFDHVVLKAAREGGFAIINIQVASQFTTHLSMSAYLALIAAMPYILYEVWKFIRPALYPHEKKSLRKGFLLGGVLFYLGCLTGFFIIFPLTFRFLAGYELSHAVVNTINLTSYTGLFNSIILIFGLCFEMPMLLLVLSLMGILDRDTLKQYRRHATVGILVLAAVITPSGDPVTLLVVFAPLYLLYEFSIFLIKPARD